MSELERTVGQVARMARVSVRTLHHYDEIGLLVPTGRSETGYRLYGPGDVERLHAVLLLRELGLPLEEIRTILDQAPEARLDALVMHRERLVQRADRLGAALRAVDAWKESERRTKSYGPKEWAEMKAEAERIESTWASHLDAGLSPEDRGDLSHRGRHPGRS